jgi:hypothetical protein
MCDDTARGEGKIWRVEVMQLRSFARVGIATQMRSQEKRLAAEFNSAGRCSPRKQGAGEKKWRLGAASAAAFPKRHVLPRLCRLGGTSRSPYWLTGGWPGTGLGLPMKA